jgi:hypothetical protein
MNNYTKQDYERDIKILEGAPEGATHCDNGGNYESDYTWYKNTKFGYEVWMWEEKEWRLMPDDCIECPADIRSLSDIRALVTLYEQLQGDTNE